jgi:hypothetical protein
VTSFEALNVELSVLGQTLRGNFAFDKVSSGASSGHGPRRGDRREL